MSQNEKWGFILNPIAGNGFGRKFEKTVEEKINQYGINGVIKKTEGKGHATEIAASWVSEGFTHIVAVGGDGTMNETARSLVGNQEIVFGCVSAGTGNDFIQVLGFSDHFTDADWEIFFQRKTIPMDVGKVNDNYFLNGMGIGFDAQVASENFANPDGTTGNYLWHILKHLFFYKEKVISLESEAMTVNSSCFMTTISNGRRFAGGYLLTPEAIANDGLLDVCHVDPLNLFQRLYLFLKVPRGAHLGNKKVRYFKTDKLNVHFDREVPYHLDGELFFDSDFDVSFHPIPLKIIYNPQGSHFFNVDGAQV